jgi:hypothetical protein
MRRAPGCARSAWRTQGRRESTIRTGPLVVPRLDLIGDPTCRRSPEVRRRAEREEVSVVTQKNDLLRGGCLCGSVRYEITGPLGIVEHCHCSMCRKAHGAAFSTNSVVPAAAITVTSGAAFISEYAPSSDRRKCFCSKCGSQMFIRRLNMPEFTVVTLGTIDGDPHARPERHVFVASKAPWYDIADALPRFEVYPGFEPAEDEPPA